MNFSSRFLQLSIVWLLGFLTRVLPHFPNATSTLTSTVYLSTQQSCFRAILSIFSMGICSDIVLSLIQGVPFFQWIQPSIYFIYLMIIIGSRYLSRLPALYRIVLAILFFWISSNAWVWWGSGYYAHSYEGFVSAYIYALPFLRNMLISELIWAYLLSVHWHKLGYNHSENLLRTPHVRVKSVVSPY